jgi:hypothetical protein
MSLLEMTPEPGLEHFVTGIEEGEGDRTDGNLPARDAARLALADYFTLPFATLAVLIGVPAH